MSAREEASESAGCKVGDVVRSIQPHRQQTASFFGARAAIASLIADYKSCEASATSGLEELEEEEADANGSTKS